MREPPLVLLLEDDERVAALIDHSLTRAGFHMLREPNGTKPDVIIVAGLHQLEPARQVASAPLLLLTTNDCVDERVRGLNAGADDVLAKPFVLEELLACVRALLRRSDLNTAASRHGTLHYHDVELDQDRRIATRGRRQLELRNRAFELLAYFLKHQERVLSKSELLEQVWGYEFLGDSNVIEVTVGHVRQALEAGGEPRLIYTVRPVGYILRA
jgi:two-component system, OmpR family, response regulator MprA